MSTTEAFRVVEQAAEVVPVANPYTGEVLAHVPLCGPEEVDRACTRAAAALARDDFPPHARARVLDAAARRLGERQEELAQLITAESGKVIRDARAEVGRAAETLRFSAAEARTLTGEVVPMEATAAGVGKLGLAIRLPIGVVGAITPFNFPINTVAHKIAPAVAAGCPVVLKPAPQTPLTAIRLVELLVECGLPEDWITVVTDEEKRAGEALVEHPVPRLLTFTGSSVVGWGIAAKAPRKKVLLELGSNAPVIVEPGVALPECAQRIARAAFGTAGQSCISVQRVLVHRSVHAELRDLLAEAAAGLVVGDPTAEGSDVGPLITRDETARVHTWIREAAAEGGEVVSGGVLEDGCLRPTVLDRAPDGSKVRTRELFGPVLVLIAYDDFDEALRIANETPYGLQAGVFTTDLGKALRAARELDFGGVLVNDVPTYRADQQPYGGVGESGNTREGPHFAVREMTEIRFVSLQAPPLDGSARS
ncbi:aldehyde dehydrogenase family protein [Geodermatophilus sp. YIM 151500]|uniref:aldehyde dehydrogenase family protein n=1 Tax=Geodermatophilus sp. YIM 151500 TaxID=2984531 RepID=UPI0021E3C720|nr:aldehyde dehydrogenase family protein [Geodermatophilus sp. YIM 151500]MCV2489295.1 aldehyde dehydrogenase family protein [Geodermatophilus sp. YIM 151500]